MPHETIPESWVSGLLAAFGTAMAWLGRYYLPRVRLLEGRIVTLERLQALADVRYRAYIRRLEQTEARAERIERRGERIEDKIDRLSERL